MANPPVNGDSTSPTTPGVTGTNEAPNGVGVYGEVQQQGKGVHGICNGVAPADFTSAGVWGESQYGIGVYGHSLGQMQAVAGINIAPQSPAGPGVWGQSSYGQGVWGESQNSEGVHGISHGQVAGVAGFNDATQGPGQGVWGESQNSEGVHGVSHGNAAGVAGFSTAAQGVWGESQNWEGVHGVSHGNAAGVAGFSTAAQGVWGESQNWEGVHGVSHGQAAGVAGFNDAPQSTAAPGSVGVWGESQNLDGVSGVSHSAQHAGVAANNGAGGYGLWARAKTAGYFDGDVEVTGDVRLINADVAENFNVVEPAVASPGTVMVLDETGALEPGSRPYDKRVVGVVSGAGRFKPGLILDSGELRASRVQIALVGKVFCKVDASTTPIDAGDLLTTSSTPGHAMKAGDPVKAFGAVIGKALDSFRSGRGLIPILVALQ